MPAPDRLPLWLPRILVPLALILPALALPPPARAGQPAPAPDALRLSVHVELERRGPLAGDVERGQSRLRQHLELAATLQAMGGALAYNPLDPDDARRQLDDARRTQQRVQSALDRRPATTVPAMDPAAMQARAQQMLARCGQDRACLMREASAMSAATVSAGMPTRPAANTQARLQAYGQAAAACEREANAAARKACQDRARRAAGGGDEATDPTARDDELPEPYRMYAGAADCGLRLQAAIDERIEGDFGDVQGRVPFTQTVSARLDGPQAPLCPLLQVVLDTRSGRLWTRVIEVTPELGGVWERRERGRQPQRQEGRHPLDWREAAAPLQQRLLQLDARGQDAQRLPLAGGGEILWRVRWQFDPS
jgi:hypothetical protein